MAAFLTDAQRAAIDEAYTLLKDSNVTERQGINEDVARRLAKIAADLGFEEPQILTQLRDRPIKTILQGVLYLNDNA